MRIGDTGVVGKELTDANEPILRKGEQVIGFRELTYGVYKPLFLAKRTLVADSRGWVWLTTRRCIHLGHDWIDLPEGTRGKKYDEWTFEEAIDVVHKRRSVRVTTQDSARGRVVFSYAPMGAAARLFLWLKKEKDHRRAIAKGKAISPYVRKEK